MTTKNHRNPRSGRYAPPDLIRTEWFNVQLVKDVSTICTSHMERHNLTLRTFMKQFTRLSLGFSKKLENLAAAVALQVAHYNFCWRLRKLGNSGELTPTPAMAAGIVSELWNIERLYDEVMGLAEQRKRHAATKRLVERLGRKD